MEWLRAKLQDSEQIRGGGMRLGGPAGSVWTPSDADWLAAARMGRRRRAVAGDALAETTVRGVSWLALLWTSLLEVLLRQTLLILMLLCRLRSCLLEADSGLGCMTDLLLPS